MKVTFTIWNDADYLEGRAIKKSPLDSFREEPACRVGDLVTNTSGEVHQFFLYNAWGENMHEYNPVTPGFDSPYRFNAKELDKETGLAYYGARYYQNKFSVWLSVDKLAQHSNQLDKSPYAFDWNNPVNLVDPDGNCPWCLVGIAIEDMLAIGVGIVVTTNTIVEIHDLLAYNDTKYEWFNWGSKGGYVNVYGSESIFSNSTDATYTNTTTVPLSESSQSNGEVSFSQQRSIANSLSESTTDTESENNSYITLYRGVGIDKKAMHKLAMMGTAIPLGLDNGGHDDPELHNEGDNWSIFTSWTTSKDKAIKFASDAGPGGVVLTKTFNTNETVKSPDAYSEDEVLIPGVVSGAQVEILRP